MCACVCVGEGFMVRIPSWKTVWISMHKSTQLFSWELFLVGPIDDCPRKDRERKRTFNKHQLFLNALSLICFESFQWNNSPYYVDFYAHTNSLSRILENKNQYHWLWIPARAKCPSPVTANNHFTAVSQSYYGQSLSRVKKKENQVLTPMCQHPNLLVLRSDLLDLQLATW